MLQFLKIKLIFRNILKLFKNSFLPCLFSYQENLWMLQFLKFLLCPVLAVNDTNVQLFFLAMYIILYTRYEWLVNLTSPTYLKSNERNGTIWAVCSWAVTHKQRGQGCCTQLLHSQLHLHHLQLPRDCSGLC